MQEEQLKKIKQLTADFRFQFGHRSEAWKKKFEYPNLRTSEEGK